MTGVWVWFGEVKTGLDSSDGRDGEEIPNKKRKGKGKGTSSCQAELAGAAESLLSMEAITLRHCRSSETSTALFLYAANPAEHASAVLAPARI